MERRILSLCLWAALSWFGGSALAAQEPDATDDNTQIESSDPNTNPDALLEEAEREREALEARTRLNAVLIVQLSQDLEPAQRAAVEAVIDTLPTVLEGEDATHVIAPLPALGDIVVLHEVHGAAPFARPALWQSLERQGALNLAQIYEHFSTQFQSKYAWGSNAAQPIELGDIEAGDFAARLRGELLRIGRHGALLDYGATHNDGSLSVCLSNTPAPSGFCPLPTRGLKSNQVWLWEPIYLTVESTRLDADYFTVMLIDRLGRITPLTSGRATPYTLGTVAVIGDDAPADARPSQARLFFGPDTPIKAPELQPGHYDLLVLATQEPIPVSVWAQSHEANPSDPSCPEDYVMSLCRTMQLQKGGRPANMVSEAAAFRVGVMGEIPTMELVVKGFPAAESVSLWQAQLFRYRKEQIQSISGRSVYNYRSSHKCGGAYIGEGFVLTAAHCVPKEASEMRVRLGARNIRQGGRAFKVRSLVQHKRGNSRSGRVDLALLQLAATPSQLGTLDNSIAPVALSTRRDPNFSRLSGLTVTGWGFIKERLPGETGWLAADGSLQLNADQLQQLFLAQADMSECMARQEYSAYLPQDMLCLRGAMQGSDTCAGDSGGPVTSRMDGGRRLVGIVSTGIGCAFEGLPAVYVNVAQHGQWIAKAKRKMLTSRAGYYEMD
ncbi:MAG: serine protease [Pseudomonadota bacterium]